MKTIIFKVSSEREGWFQTLFQQFGIQHRVLSDEENEELQLARLIDEAMAEEGEVSRGDIDRFIEKHGR